MLIKSKLLDKIRSFFHSELRVKVRNWLLYGVIWSFIPIFFLLLCKLIIGYKVSILDLMPDYLLIVFAVSVNLLGNSVDCRDSVAEDKRKNIAGFARFSMAICACFYLAFFSEFVSKEIVESLGSKECPLLWLFSAVTVILILVALLGVVLKRREIKATGKSSN